MTTDIRALRYHRLVVLWSGNSGDIYCEECDLFMTGLNRTVIHTTINTVTIRKEYLDRRPRHLDPIPLGGTVIKEDTQ